MILKRLVSRWIWMVVIGLFVVLNIFKITRLFQSHHPLLAFTWMVVALAIVIAVIWELGEYN